jgi:uncharacterized membrane protein YjgN (DUF898 family)
VVNSVTAFMADDTPSEEQHFPFAFTGTAGDYFRIWIVSLCLSLLTIGIYSAWGKVRKRRYLYAHTELDGTGFDYRASPLAILRGRIMALVLFGGLALAGHFVPMVQLALIALLLLLTPWIVVAAARFNARNSTYRNIAFAFDGRVGEAAPVFIGGALIALVMLGAAYPWYRARRARFIVAHHRYGASQFGTDLRTRGFVVTYLLAALMLFAALTTLGVLATGVAILARRSAADFETSRAGYVFALVTYAIYIALYAYVRARTQNLVTNATTIGPLRLAGTLRARRLAWLYLSNIVAVLLTLGLATAWATIRVARYRAENLIARANAPLESYVAGPQAHAGATGSEVSDLFDVDVSL